MLKFEIILGKFSNLDLNINLSQEKLQYYFCFFFTKEFSQNQKYL